MKVKGKVTDIVQNGFNCGMVSVAKLGKIFFSPPDTEFINLKFEDLKIGDTVTLEYRETPRGLFASSIEFGTKSKLSALSESSQSI